MTNEKPPDSTHGSFEAQPTSIPCETSRADLFAARSKCGIGAGLGWLFAGLEMYLYTLVAGPLVGELLGTDPADRAVLIKSSLIQAAFMIGWASGGGLFGRLGDRAGRSRVLSITILIYSFSTFISFFAVNWQQLLMLRLITGLGIGGEWTAGSALLSETWPKRSRPWIASILQAGVNVGVLLAAATTYALAAYPKRYVFLVGGSPLLLAMWVNRCVPEPTEWRSAKRTAGAKFPKGRALFAPRSRHITILATIVCAFTLTGWWGFSFWINQHWPRLAEVAQWPRTQQQQLVSKRFFEVIGVSVIGCFFGGWVAKRIGYHRAISLMCAGLFLTMFGAFIVPRDHNSLRPWVLGAGFFSGVLGLFAMYLPPLFPTLLRTTGTGFCYNIGRLLAATGILVFGLTANLKDFRTALLIDSFLFLPAAMLAWVMPETVDNTQHARPIRARRRT